MKIKRPVCQEHWQTGPDAPHYSLVPIPSYFGLRKVEWGRQKEKPRYYRSYDFQKYWSCRSHTE
jgi:hypothetical protein